MVNFILMCGLVGSGKSTEAKKLAEVYNAHVVESDKYRETIYGNSEQQGNNEELFKLIHKDILSHLSSGKSVILDATNVRRKFRKPILDQVSKISGVKKIAYVVATEKSICIEQNNFRERNVPVYVIERMWKNFEIPSKTEGFDEIEIVYNYDWTHYNFIELMAKMDSFEQDNPYHSFTLGEHSKRVCNSLEDDGFLNVVGFFHDIGKLWTKTYIDMKGNKKEHASYYNHENVGCYESLFYLNEYGFIKDEIIDASNLILLHMRLYQAKTQKAVDKLKEIIGEELYPKLMLLHESDRNNH